MSSRAIAADTLAPPLGTTRTVHRQGTTLQIMEVLLHADTLAADYTVHFAPELEGGTIRKTCRNIHRFIQDNIVYKEDPAGVQDIKSPSQLFTMGVGDCKSFSLFAASCLQNLDIPYFYRFVGFAGDEEVTHVYVVALDEELQEVIIDAVPPIRFDEEVNYSFKKDKNPQPAIGSCPPDAIPPRPVRTITPAPAASQRAAPVAALAVAALALFLIP